MVAGRTGCRRVSTPPENRKRGVSERFGHEEGRAADGVVGRREGRHLVAVPGVLEEEELDLLRDLRFGGERWFNAGRNKQQRGAKINAPRED